MIHKKFLKPLVLASMAALAISALGVVAAGDTEGTAEVTGGDLTMTAPLTHNFGTVVLDGTNQTITSGSLVLNVKDARGTGAGWHINIAATTFSDGVVDGETLATDALKVTEASSVAVTGTNAVNNVPYALTVPVTAVKLFNAAVDTGMGEINVTPTFTIDIPATTQAATYTSTITTTVATGP